MRNRTMWIATVGGFAILVIAAVFASRFGVDPGLTPSPLIGKAAPDVTMEYLMDEGDFSLGSLAGDITVVNFWASWCLGCRQEHGALLAAAADYRDLGVTFVGIQYQDQLSDGIEFLEELGFGPPGYVYVRDPDSRAAVRFGVLGLPETFFIDRSGAIVAKVSGPVSYDLVASTLNTIIAGGIIGDDGIIRTGEVENRDS